MFISHSNLDIELVRQVQNSLKTSGFDAYVAVMDMKPGELIPKKVKKHIADSDAFIVILSENSSKSAFVREEIGYACDRVPIVQLLIGDTKPSGLLEGVEGVPYNDVNLGRLDDIVREAITRHEPQENREVCKKGPYEVEPGSQNYTEIPLNVRKGERIHGRIEEVNGMEFDWYILDEANLVRHKNSEEFWFERSERSIEASRIYSWKVPRNGPWFLVLEAPLKQDVREVLVDLRSGKARSP